MTKRKPPVEEVDLYEEEDEEEGGHELDATIAAGALLDMIEAEPVEDDEDDDGPTRYRLTFHAILPEHIAKQFFGHYVKDNQVTVEFHPNLDAETVRRALLSR